MKLITCGVATNCKYCVYCNFTGYSIIRVTNDVYKPTILNFVTPKFTCNCFIPVGLLTIPCLIV